MTEGFKVEVRETFANERATPRAPAILRLPADLADFRVRVWSSLERRLKSGELTKVTITIKAER